MGALSRTFFLLRFYNLNAAISLLGFKSISRFVLISLAIISADCIAFAEVPSGPMIVMPKAERDSIMLFQLSGSLQNSIIIYVFHKLLFPSNQGV